MFFCVCCLSRREEAVGLEPRENYVTKDLILRSKIDCAKEATPSLPALRDLVPQDTPRLTLKTSTVEVSLLNESISTIKFAFAHFCKVHSVVVLFWVAIPMFS